MVEWEKIAQLKEDELAIFTDRFLKNKNVGYGIAANTKESIEGVKMIWEESGSLEGKSVLEAETWAIFSIRKKITP